MPPPQTPKLKVKSLRRLVRVAPVNVDGSVVEDGETAAAVNSFLATLDSKDVKSVTSDITVITDAKTYNSFSTVLVRYVIVYEE